MKLLKNTITIIVEVIILILFIIWFVETRHWEPIIGIIGSAGFLATSLFFKCFEPLYTTTYTPPEEPGVVYVVIKKQKKKALYRWISGTTNIQIGCEWGKWKSGIKTINVVEYKGLVLCLKHDQHGSYPLLITTDGTILSISQFTGDMTPKQWNEQEYYKRILY